MQFKVSMDLMSMFPEMPATDSHEGMLSSLLGGFAVHKPFTYLSSSRMSARKDGSDDRTRSSRVVYEIT